MTAFYAALVVVMVWLLRDGAKAMTRFLEGFVGAVEVAERREREARIERNRKAAIARMAPDYRAQLTELWNRPEYVAARDRIAREVEAEEGERFADWAEDIGDYFGQRDAA